MNVPNEKPCLPVFLYFMFFPYAVLIDLQKDKKALRVTDVGFFLK